MEPTKPVKTPDSSIFDGTLGTVIIAAIVGGLTFAVICLSNVFAGGIFYATTTSALKYGAATFALVLVVNILPSKIGPWFLLLMVAVIAFFFFPAG